ncbi:hypothetical protein PYCC9005_000025 [Savitreella phatthalungensis]
MADAEISQDGKRHSRRQSMQLRRQSSIRGTGSIIPLMLQGDTNKPVGGRTAEQGSYADYARTHKRQSSVQQQHHGSASMRPASMFFGRMFGGGLEGGASIVHQTDGVSAAAAASGMCSTAQDPQMCLSRAEARLRAQVDELQTVIEAKDMTLSVLRESLEDAQQEIEILRGKMRIYEASFLNTGELPHGLASSVLFEPDSRGVGLDHITSDSMRRQRSAGIESVADSAVFSDGITSRATSPTRPRLLSNSSSTSIDSGLWSRLPGLRRASPTSLTALACADVIHEEADGESERLRLENEALRGEVARLNAALDDGLGALAELGL